MPGKSLATSLKAQVKGCRGSRLQQECKRKALNDMHFSERPSLARFDVALFGLFPEIGIGENGETLRNG